MNDPSLTPRRILVLCTGNRARSQMAEGWLRHFTGERAEVFSAGTHPKGVHPLAIQVMREAGVDISSHRSKHLSEYLTQPFDVVVTVCDHAKEACPVFPGAKRTVHQPFSDPDGPDASAETFRRIRDQIRQWARDFVNSDD